MGGSSAPGTSGYPPEGGFSSIFDATRLKNIFDPEISRSTRACRPWGGGGTGWPWGHKKHLSDAELQRRGSNFFLRWGQEGPLRPLRKGGLNPTLCQKLFETPTRLPIVPHLGGTNPPGSTQKPLGLMKTHCHVVLPTRFYTLQRRDIFWTILWKMSFANKKCKHRGITVSK